jgi:hypothetical protein
VPLPGKRAVADRERFAEDGPEVPRRYPRRNRAVPDPQLAQLLTRNNTVLLLG